MEAPNVVSLIDVIRHPLVSVVVLMEVFMVYTQDRVLLRLVEQIIVSLQRLPSRTLTFQLLVVHLTMFIKILFLQLVLQICWAYPVLAAGAGTAAHRAADCRRRPFAVSR